MSISIALGLGGVAAGLAANGNDGPVVTYKAVISTSLGDIELELYGKDAPKTVANFVGLAEKGFYNDILFHRVVPGFVIQAGDPKTKDTSLKHVWGTGGESIYGHEFEDELDPAAPSYVRGYAEGVLAMANRGKNTNTSQWFICLADVQLPKNYTIFGKVTKGMDVVHKIEHVDLAGSAPREPVKITGVSVKKVED
ncbi:MAG: peptidylprolyl isomerase [Bacteroidetes bacterium]|nr:peptidylprolyl isomerase [Bacteroidota bacterium]